MANPGFLSKRVKKKSQLGLTSDRYEFLGLDQAEPDLGDPLVGPSSVGAKPYTGSISDLYVVVSSGSGQRYWSKQTSVISGGLAAPGNVTIRSGGNIFGDVNKINDINFVGSGVTVKSGSWAGAGSSAVDVQITVTDLAVTGNTGAVPYKASTGFLVGSTDLIYSSSSKYVGIGSTTPTVKLDVTGDAKVSGMLTASKGEFTTSLKIGSFSLDTDQLSVTNLSIPNGSIGIGTTRAIASLDVRGSVNLSGITTIINLVGTSASFTNLSAGVATVGFITANSAYLGILTINSLTSGNPVFNGTGYFTGNIGVGSTTPLRRIDIVGSATTDQSQVAIRLLNTNTTGYGAYIGLNASSIGRNYHLVSTGVSEGIGAGKFSIYDVSANSHRFVIGTTGNVGIGTTNPQYPLDINGPVGINSILYVGGSAGFPGYVLLSNGSTSAASWGALGNATAGAATSVTITTTSSNLTYYPTFTEQSISGNIANIRIDSIGLAYNPGTDTLGIGTTNVTTGVNTAYNLVARTSNITGFATFSSIQVSGVATFTNNLQVNGSTLFVISSSDRVAIGTTNPTAKLDVRGDVSVATTVTIGSQNQLTTGILTSTTTSTQTVDSFPSSSIRSAKYNIQVTTTGQLVSSASSSPSPSVTSLGGGNNYVSGNYTNVALSTVTGTGNDAYADISITPEVTLTLSAISAGKFISSETSTDLRVNEPIIFNKAIAASAKENSRVTSIVITSPGSGYTAVPTIGLGTPTNSPAISGVGIASTATASVATLIITDVTINTAGIHTIIPTVSFNSPIGGGSSAQGIVGFGVSTVRVTNAGYGYTEVFPVSISGGIGIATVGITSVFVTNLIINNTGTGYTGTSGANYPTITIDPPTSGTTATASVNSLGISNIFGITTGIGYTTPPILTVSAPTTGVNTATVAATLGVSTFTVTNSGSGYLSSPSITLSAPSVPGFSGRVGLGITGTVGNGITFSPGVLYQGTSGTAYTVPGVGGIGTGAILSLAFSAPGNLINVTIVNPGYGYTVPPVVNLDGFNSQSGQTSSGAAITFTNLMVTDVTVFNSGYGVSSTPTVTIGQPAIGVGATAIASMGIGSVDVINFGSGYTTKPSIAVTSIVGTGASVTAGLGVTSTNITITNAGVGYTVVPKVRVSTPVGVGTSTTGIIGVGITGISVSYSGYGYTGTIPLVSSSPGVQNPGTRFAAEVSSIIVTNVAITSTGLGYTAADLANTPIASYSPTGTASTVGFGVSTVRFTSLGIGYTNQASATVTFSKPNIGIGSTATATAFLGYPGILPGPGYGLTTQIYYVSSIPNSQTVAISTGVGVGTLTVTDVADGTSGTDFTDVSYFVGGSISNVNIVSPGSGYSATSKLTATNFDGGNVGYGFSFVSATVVNNYQISDVMVLNNVGAFSTTPDYIEYGTLANNEILGAFDADLSSSNVRLLFTPTYRDNIIKVNKNYTTT